MPRDDSACETADADPRERVYWTIVWREGSDVGWLCSLDGNRESTTIDPSKRLRYSTKPAAMAALWRFRRDNPKRPNEIVRVVRVTVRLAVESAPVAMAADA